MPAAAKPKNEEERVRTLESYNVLDTLPEADFNEIVQLASFICNSPIALVSLVDRGRQWFKAKIGVDVDETPREFAFCAHAILNPNEPLIVEDATKDERFSDNDLVTKAPDIRFYAGCPLNTPSGESLGTLCAIDTKPKKITKKQIDALKVLANNVVSILELRKAHIKNEEFIEKLKESNEELERFAYVASHDLQEPLRMVCSFTEMLEKKYGGSLDETAKEYINISHSSAMRMQALVDDLLEYARISQEAEKYEDVDCIAAVDYIKQNLKDDIAHSNAEITNGTLPVIQSNPVRFSRVLQNIVGNAMKYQQEGNQPKIHISVEENSDEWVFSVKDNGIGMKQEYCEKIFLPFQRLHKRDEYSGTGIGLAICTKIVESQGGRIWAESGVGKGSSIYFSIPKNTG